MKVKQALKKLSPYIETIRIEGRKTYHKTTLKKLIFRHNPKLEVTFNTFMKVPSSYVYPLVPIKYGVYCPDYVISYNEGSSKYIIAKVFLMRLKANVEMEPVPQEEINLMRVVDKIKWGEY